MLTLAVAGALQSVAFSGFAQDAASSEDDSKAKVLDKVSVTGSQIAGSGAQAAVPVISLSREQVEATGATDGNELMRSLPQMGDVTWNPTFLSGANSNAARGDIGSINLRNMGASNTLLLLNGRRTVVHPTTATVDGGVSSTTYNSNAIPMYGLDRMDLLLDGAAAIYGSDAVAGVVNVVTQENLADGGGVKLQYGTAEGTHREDTELSGYFGKDFADGRGNVSVLYNLSHRSSQLMSDMWYTATSNRSSFVSPLTGGVTNGTSTYTPYGTFRRYSNKAALTGTYYVNSAGEVVSGSVPAALRTDTAAEPGITASPKTDRANLFTTAHFDLTDSVQLYGEAGYYRGKTQSWINSQTNGGNLPIYVKTDAYWVPDELKTGGADAIAVTNYLINSGIRPVEVTNTQYRALAGLRGWTDSGWNWDTGLLYSRANVKDSMITINATKFVEAVNRTDASAYNVFTGGNNPGDTSEFMEWFTRETTSELALWDFKVNRSDLFSWYAGDIGMAAGIEVRYESLKDDRGSIIDGTQTFTDWYTGVGYASNLFGSSATPDSYGSRNVKSAFIEFAVPLVSPDQGIPLVQSLDLQVAGRYEDYSDAGDVAKPKLALAWKVNDSLLLRGSASQGFKAPNLELVNSGTQSRFFGYPDYVRCEAMMANGTYSAWTSCIAGLGTSTVIWDVSGNKNLKPEVSKNKSAGFVYEPTFIPDSIGDFSFGIDWWKIDIENPIGVVSALTHLYYDAYLRVVEGSSDPAIVRNPVTAEDIAQFAGSGLDPVGSVNRVYLTYENLSPINAEGIDYNASWRLRGTRFGDFSVLLSASHLKSYSQAPTEAEQKIQQAINSGQLELTVAALGANQVGLNGAKPEWKGSATFVWKYEDWTVTARDQYTGSLVSGVWADRTPWKVASQQRWNLAVKKDFREGALSGYGFELGARNLFDKDPPLAADGTYLASLYEPYGRYLYLSIEKTW